MNTANSRCNSLVPACPSHRLQNSPSALRQLHDRHPRPVPTFENIIYIQHYCNPRNLLVQPLPPKAAFRAYPRSVAAPLLTAHYYRHTALNNLADVQKVSNVSYCP